MEKSREQVSQGKSSKGEARRERFSTTHISRVSPRPPSIDTGGSFWHLVGDAPASDPASQWGAGSVFLRRFAMD